jgi:hypothetical protein
MTAGPAGGAAAPGAAERFPMRIEPAWRIPLRFWGVRPSNAYIDLDDRRMDAHFGWGSLATELSNVTGYELSGPWAAVTAIGIRRGLRSGDASFCGTNREGVLLHFREGVRWGRFLKPHALTVTPEDRQGFVQALEARGVRRFAHRRG